MASVLWFQAGACSGNTMSFLNADEPNVVDLIVDFGLDVVWHPSLGVELGDNAKKIFTDCVDGDPRARHLRVRGHRDRGPERHRPDGHVRRPADEGVGRPSWRAAASIVVAIGDCACWGGIPAMAPNPTDSTGLQFHKREQGRVPRPGLQSQGGPARHQHPGLPGAPRLDHPDPRGAGHRAAPATSRWTTCTGPRRSSRPSPRPAAPGCSSSSTSSRRPSFGEGTRTGCLFYEFGCRGPMTHSPCNRILWNRQSSKTRAGMPCMGCTEPEFPHFDLAPGTRLQDPEGLRAPSRRRCPRAPTTSRTWPTPPPPASPRPSGPRRTCSSSDGHVQKRAVARLPAPPRLTAHHGHAPSHLICTSARWAGSRGTSTSA